MQGSKGRHYAHRVAHVLLWGLCVMAAVFALAVSVALYHHRPKVGINNAARYDIHGIDVSHHQGSIRWEQVKKATLHGRHITFVFARCTNGSTQVDRCYARNQEQIRNHGFLFGAYHYYVPGRSIEQQARNFIEHSRLMPGDMPPVLDVEEQGNLSDSQLAYDVVRWMTIVGEHYNCTPILYAPSSFRRTHLHDARMQRYPYWKSRYMDRGMITGRNWVFCQYTQHGHVAGITGGKHDYVDLNVFYGTPEDLKSMLLTEE